MMFSCAEAHLKVKNFCFLYNKELRYSITSFRLTKLTDKKSIFKITLSATFAAINPKQTFNTTVGTPDKMLATCLKQILWHTWSKIWEHSKAIIWEEYGLKLSKELCFCCSLGKQGLLSANMALHRMALKLYVAVQVSIWSKGIVRPC